MKEVQNSAIPDAPGATYSYDPGSCQDKSVNQMRFELGDTDVRGKSRTAALCNEEYTAMIKGKGSWNQAKLACLEAIVMKLSFEVDTSVGGLSYSLSARADRWMQMRDKLKQQLTGGIPCGNAQALSSPAYFYPGMLSNRRKG
jgi:hypothetical protein